ncbi:MAG: NAD-dependent epimerase/dehydratase family protein [Paludibacteraceae bacterium]|nr:NAD-dependent epimerase/dehydratase family protein [Paludibacteraceae bacterium]
MKTVFLTGATGTMGFAGMTELLRYPDQYKVRILARPSEKNKKLLAKYLDRIEVVWGDLTKYDDVLRGVTGSDIVLHVGGMVSPQADYRPTATRKTNLSAAKNIRDAVLAQDIEHQPKVVYIGSVAQMGDRREPLHWGRTGDPICVSAYDHYGITKALAERIITNSPIKHWVSLRQSGILYPAILKNFDPIMFHVPVRGVLEWATVEDSGRLLERICRDEVPEEFWKRYYNIGSGEQYRLSNYEFECLLLDAIGCPKPEQIFDSKWFTTRNFHGMWYLDGDVLENYLHFRANVPVKDYFAQMAKSDTLPFALKWAIRSKLVYAARLVPHIVKAVMHRLSLSTEHGTQWWIKNNRLPRIHAYYGSLEAYQAIQPWDKMDLSHNSPEAVILDHGYDENKPMSEFTLEDMQRAAAFRGGQCLSSSMVKGDWDTPLQWQCAQGHVFTATPRLILLGGHWCPDCFPYPYQDEPNSRPWEWDAEAKRNPFFAQLWAPLHDESENNVYGPEVFTGWEK